MRKMINHLPPVVATHRMSVSPVAHLLCIDARLTIELDGSQHLGNPDAYRRDRRKDQLLQENGFFVLRFLAEDIGKKLGSVLDTIERALVSRRLVNGSAEQPRPYC